jgi:hypothetical protein
MPDHAAERIRAGKPMGGLVVLRRDWRRRLREIIEDVVLIGGDDPKEWQNRIEYLPI